jgi:hypothetical protein
MVSREQVRTELQSAYKRRRDDTFVQLLLRGVVDPVKPLSETKRRRFHPLLIAGTVLVILCVAAALLVSR